MDENRSEQINIPETEKISEKEPKGTLSAGRIAAIAVAVLLLASGTFWGLSLLSSSSGQDLTAQRKELAKSWEAAQKDKAQGVDFKMAISNDEIKGKPSLDFGRKGIVTATEGCFEATSQYIVQTDGSLAIEDLSKSSKIAEKSNCEGSEAGPLFWTSKVSFNMENSNSWIAYGADGKPLIPGLKEKPIVANSDGAESSTPSP